MQTTITNSAELKEAFKSAIVEVLQERKELMADLIVEILEDIALTRAIAEGEKTSVVSREKVFELLEQAH